MGYSHLNYLIGEATNESYNPENDEFYRQLYMDIVMDSLEIEPLTKSMLRLRDIQIKELTQKFNFLFDGYKNIERMAKPLIDFHTRNEDGEMTIRVKQTTVTDPMAEAQRIEPEEQESGEENSQEPEYKEETKTLSPKEKKEAELKEWQRTRDRINSIPHELKVGEPVLIVWGNCRKIETEVRFKKEAENENNLQSASDQNSAQSKE